MRMTNFNGFYGCPRCLAKGQYDTAGKVFTYPFEENLQKRTPEGYMENLMELRASDRKEPVCGVKGPTCRVFPNTWVKSRGLIRRAKGIIFHPLKKWAQMHRFRDNGALVISHCARDVGHPPHGGVWRAACLSGGLPADAPMFRWWISGNRLIEGSV